jgi:hypothetical protein
VTHILDGFWLPTKIKQEIIRSETPWIIQRYKAGRPTDQDGPETVGARWPVLSPGQWKQLLDLLHEQRGSPPPDFFDRLEKSFAIISRRFNDPTDPLTKTALRAIPVYTGYSPEMIRFVLGALDLIPVTTLGEIVDLELPAEVQRQFVPFQKRGELGGRVKFYHAKSENQLKRFFSKVSKKPLTGTPVYPDQVLGYAAGNVIGTAHLISLLAQVSALIQRKKHPGELKFPAILVKNSRQEPIFAPLIFSALEEIDPQLTSTIALMIWDYSEASLQEYLISQSDLVIAAAADLTIDQIDEVIQRVQTPSHPIRFHAHGHKVSFTTIGKEYLEKKARVSKEVALEIIHLITLLAAVDSIFWDQYGCLSSRVHFVECANSATYTPLEYGHLLAEKIRLLSTFITRGSIPLHGLHTRFEKYVALTPTGQVQLCSNYEDDFLVIVDSRPWTQAIFQEVINDCVERTIVIRPITDLLEVPDRYLSWLPAKNLQTMSVAIDGPENHSWSPNFTQFVDAIGKRGVTGVRTIGRGPFPQLAYSWDGYLPLDLSLDRPPGRFTTVEFENTYHQILETYQIYASRSGLGLM